MKLLLSENLSRRIISALLEAELNINYLYSFIPHPHGKSILGLSMEDSHRFWEAANQRPI